MYSLKRLSEDEITNDFEVISLTLQKAVDTVDNPGWDGLDFISHSIDNPEIYNIWVIMDGSSIICYFSTMIMHYPNYMAVSITTLAAVEEGTDILGVFTSLMPEFEAKAKDIGCEIIEIVGRKGWGRLFKDYNIKSTTFTKNIYKETYD